MISATALQFHPHCAVVLDEAAASWLQEADYYRWIFENEPQWESFRNELDGAGPDGPPGNLVGRESAAAPVNPNRQRVLVVEGDEGIRRALC